MKKTILIFLVCIVFIRCSISNGVNITKRFEIYKIDSLKAYYLIYAMRDSVRYKIVSKKQDNSGCRNYVKVGGIYALKIHSMSQINGRPITPAVSKYEVSGILVDERTTISFERDTHWDLYFADNVKGICFIKN